MAVVAALTLLLGVAAGALVVGSEDDQPTSPPTDAEVGDPPSTGAAAGATTTVTGPLSDDDTDDEERSDRPGSVVVGNSVYTASYQSNSDKTTDPFEIGDDWEIRWDVDGGTLSIEVVGGRGETVEVVEARGRGQRSFPQGGTYHLQLWTDGSRYGVVVTDGP